MREFFFNVMPEAGENDDEKIRRERAPLSDASLLDMQGGEIGAIFYSESRRAVKSGDRFNEWLRNFISVQCNFNVFVSD